VVKGVQPDGTQSRIPLTLAVTTVRKLSLAAITVGGIVDIVATTALAIPLLVYAAIESGLSSLPPAEQTDALAQAMQASSGLQIAGWALGVLASVLGGYVAARIARRDEVLHGALSAFLCLALGVYALASGSGDNHVWQHVAGFVLSPALGAFGGYLRQRRTNSSDGEGLTPAHAAF
jgi:MFS family permease